jgi:hypothetical protein
MKSSLQRHFSQIICAVLLLGMALSAPVQAQQILGTITGTVKDSTGASVPDATVKAHNLATNLEVVEHTQGNGFWFRIFLPERTA